MSEPWLERAVAAWRGGDHYAAHEDLEELADELEDDDQAAQIALALAHAAAALHKWSHDVSPQAVPAKLARALEVLDQAPAEWRGLDLAALREALHRWHDDLPSRRPGRAEAMPAPRALSTRA